MKNVVFKTIVFYLSVISFIIASSLSILKINISEMWIKVIVLIIVIVLFIWIQILQSKKISEKIKEKMLNLEIKSVDKFAKAVQDLRLRSNIFLENKKKKYYYIKNRCYAYNMDSFQDINIRIPSNMGCTGEAWRTKGQVFGDHKRIHTGGEHRIPDDQYKLIPEDLNWVLSTPIKNDNDEVIAVMNFDGNKELTPETIKDMKEHCSRLALEIGEIFD